MYQSALKHGPDPSATGLHKSALSDSRNYGAESGVVKLPLNVQKGAPAQSLYGSRTVPVYEQHGKEPFQ